MGVVGENSFLAERTAAVPRSGNTPRGLGIFSRNTLSPVGRRWVFVSNIAFPPFVIYVCGIAVCLPQQAVSSPGLTLCLSH